MANWVLQIKERTFSSPSQQPHFLFLSPPPPLLSPQFNLNNKVTPSILIIIIILALIFFISGLLHLLVRFLFRPTNTNPSAENDHNALEGQLQQLFHLHDSGVDQSFIDALPVFDYKAVTRVKGAFDCAVCLSEFEFEDKLRLLPKCSHAFHVDCIDTWLLSHSTCPLCRASLVGDDIISRCSPLVMILESGSESSRERVLEREDDGDSSDGISDQENVVSVKLGKFRSVNGEDDTVVRGEARSSLFEREDCWDSNSDVNSDVRRCFSMGSFAYVMDESSSLKVPVKKSMEKDYSKKLPGQRLAMSEFGEIEIQSGGISNKRESFSVSKIWLRGSKDETNAAGMESSERVFSFRFPMHRNPDNARESATVTGGGSGSLCNSLECEGEHHPSFGRRTLLWLMGKQNKGVFSSNV